MTTCNVNNFFIGLKIIQKNEPHLIVRNEFIKPGKGQSFNRVRMKSLLSGKIVEKIFKTRDIVQVANIKELKLTYLYNNLHIWHFINEKNFEQFSISEEIVGKNKKWMIKQTEYILTLWNDKPISVTPPNFINIKVVCSYVDKKNIVGSGNKIVLLETNTHIKVPLFIQEGDLIKVDTRSGTYISRIKVKSTFT